MTSITWSSIRSSWAQPRLQAMRTMMAVVVVLAFLIFMLQSAAPTQGNGGTSTTQVLEGHQPSRTSLQLASTLSNLTVPGTTVPDLAYEVHLAVLRHNVQTLAVWGCHQWLHHVKAAVPATVRVTLVCERDCAQHKEPNVVCTMPQQTFDMVVLDAHMCTSSRICTTQMTLDLITGANQPKVLIVADWVARALDVVELPGHAPMHRYEEQTTHRNPAGNEFTKIYQNKMWGAEGGGSGTGSTMQTTAPIRTALVDLVAKYNINSIVDAPCGSLAWMPEALNAVAPTLRYTGMDVTCHLITGHRQQFADKPNWNFYCVDVCHQPLPQGTDLIFSRDALQHLPMEFIFSFLEGVKASGAKYLLVGSYIKCPLPNYDIKIGDCFYVNLLKPPFNVSPAPVQIINEGDEHGKHMLLFDVAAMTWTKPVPGAVYGTITNGCDPRNALPGGA